MVSVPEEYLEQIFREAYETPASEQTALQKSVVATLIGGYTGVEATQRDVLLVERSHELAQLQAVAEAELAEKRAIEETASRLEAEAKARQAELLRVTEELIRLKLGEPEKEEKEAEESLASRIWNFRIPYVSDALDDANAIMRAPLDYLFREAEDALTVVADFTAAQAAALLEIPARLLFVLVRDFLFERVKGE